MATTKTKHRRTSKGSHVNLKGLTQRVAEIEKTVTKNDLGYFKPGDTVKVHARIKEGDKERIQIYEGVCIARRGSQNSRSFTVRKISHGVGVERTFMDSSPKVARVERVQEGKVRRAKLYYLRGLEGKAARIEREVETNVAAAASAAAKADKPTT